MTVRYDVCSVYTLCIQVGTLCVQVGSWWDYKYLGG